jgi:hypothetical protein
VPAYAPSKEGVLRVPVYRIEEVLRDRGMIDERARMVMQRVRQVAADDGTVDRHLLVGLARGVPAIESALREAFLKTEAADISRGKA